MGPRVDVEIQLARDGDPRAFRTITEQLGPALTRFVTFYLRGDLHAANDVVQETFIEAWRQLHRLSTTERLRPWLYHVAKCKAISWLRRRAPPGTRFEPLDTVRESSDEIASRARPRRIEGVRRGTLYDDLRRACDGSPGDLEEALRRALDDLPRTYAAVVELHYLHGLDTRETARLLNLPRTTVKMRLHRARKTLRRELERAARLAESDTGRERGPR